MRVIFMRFMQHFEQKEWEQPISITLISFLKQ
jgi:hypothetical protein